MQQKDDWCNGLEKILETLNKLFLLGVFLHLNQDKKSATTVFEAAARLGGKTPAITAFLDSQPQKNVLQAIVIPPALGSEHRRNENGNAVTIPAAVGKFPTASFKDD